MTHDLGRVVPVSQVVSHSVPFDLTLDPSPIDSPRFAILHFVDVSLSAGARLEVDLGYAIDTFTGGGGASFYTRPADAATAPIQVRIVGGTGRALLLDYGSGEPTQSGTPGTFTGSQSNPDPFLHTEPYDEPIYETRLKCSPDFAWRNARCSAVGITTAVKNRIEAASGIIFAIHDGHVTSCSGTLIAGDLFLTSRHCLTAVSGEDVRSASVTFDYSPNCDGSKPLGHAPRFFKVTEEVTSGGPTGVNNPPASTDWVVVRLDGAPGSLPDPLEMRSSNLMTGETIVSMHHPGGAVKKTQTLAYDGGSTINGFDFAGGSSGSGLFDANARMVGGPLSKGPIPGPCNVIFTPIQNVINAFENLPPPPNSLDVMVVFDKSGSMNNVAPPIGRTKLTEAQDAAALFVQLVREGAGDRIGLVTFDSGPSLDAAPAAADVAKPDLVGPMSPYQDGKIGGIDAGGTTSIGAGVSRALDAMSGTSNDRTILLLSDGLQNTAPMIEEVEGDLGDTQLCVVGFGSDAQIDGPLLSRIANDHDGQFTRAIDGLSLRKFFGVCFGNIFEDGALVDPDHTLRATEEISNPHSINVCGEEQITIIIGWDDTATPLRIHVKTPNGKSIGGKYIKEVRGRTWLFVRIPLPHNKERDGRWSFTIDRMPTGGEFPPPPTDVKYFHLVVCSGGPKLRYLGAQRRLYTGDIINPMVSLQYPNGTVPHGAKVHLHVVAPTRALGALVQESGLKPPSINEDAISAFRTTLQAIEREHGQLPVAPDMMTVMLHDDGMHDDGAMEPDGVFNNPLSEFSVVEGTYDFRVVARYGDDCDATREAFWSVHVEPGIDPDASDSSVVDVTSEEGTNRGTFVVIPRDKYGNPLGPGRPDVFEVHPVAGVTVTGGVKDRGDGSYGIGIAWGAEVDRPGILIQQPERPPGLFLPPKPKVPPDCKEPNCSEMAEALLECIGLPDSEVRKVRIKSVCFEVIIREEDC